VKAAINAARICACNDLWTYMHFDGGL